MIPNPLRRGRDLLDDALGRVTTYRLVTLVLVALAALMIGLTAAGVFAAPFTVAGQLATLAVLLLSSVVGNRVLGLLWRVQPHTESAVITALLLFMIFWPTTEGVDLVWLAVAAVLANASKYVLAWRGRHVLNPAAAGAFLVILAQAALGREAPVNATWWIAAEQLLPFVAVGALLVLWRTRRLDVGLALVLPATVLVVLGLQAAGATWADAVRTAFYSFPIVFVAGFMLSEPLTLPPRRHQQLVVAGTTALVLALPVAVLLVVDAVPDLGVLSPTPEIALLVGNLVAFAFARRAGIDLQVLGTRHLAGDTWEVAFAPRRPVRFRAGQYLELHLPHAGSDSRGVRRLLTISSPPSAEELTVAVRVPERASSFKRALVEVPAGSTLRATGVHGDFLWPRGGAPLLLVAGGIGVTPFLSQLREVRDRDVVLVLGVTDGDQVAHRDELVAAGVPVVLVAPHAPAGLPAGWTHVVAAAVSGDLVHRSVPDVARRHALVSGPPAMVNVVRDGLRGRCASLRTDHFSGY